MVDNNKDTSSGNVTKTIPPDVETVTDADEAIEIATPVEDAPKVEKKATGAHKDEDEPTGAKAIALKIVTGSGLISVLSVVAALIFGAILIAAANAEVQAAAVSGNIGKFFSTVGKVIGSAYYALFQGAIVNPDAHNFAAFIAPLFDSLKVATPLIFMGLGLAVGFRSALFNIGGQGQIIVGGIFASYVGFAFDLPPVIHLIAAIIAAVIGGMLWGFIPGILKAKTGANEVIVTIMLNSIALLLISWVLAQPAFQRPGENRPLTPAMHDNAIYPIIRIGEIQLSVAFFLAIAAVILTWWLLERSTLGFKLRATGLNPDAAKSAGINASMMSVWALMISGGFAGLAASSAVLIPATGMASGVASSYGFDAIMVALLGRSKPLGTFLSALLLGALRSGGYLMQATTSTPIDVVSVIQAVVVMFIAAPPFIRALFRLPDPEKLALRKAAKEVA